MMTRCWTFSKLSCRIKYVTVLQSPFSPMICMLIHLSTESINKKNKFVYHQGAVRTSIENTKTISFHHRTTWWWLLEWLEQWYVSITIIIMIMKHGWQNVCRLIADPAWYVIYRKIAKTNSTGTRACVWDWSSQLSIHTQHA